ncbi:MAG: hypothetical protein KZQ79_15590, partial [Candidatus Thiodiazotropha sp. (ex Lucinoma borealis)]|nr:hypothetical protein [Candidatus Thiodiazotropha sp. (ex Lucinoma borealis)]
GLDVPVECGNTAGPETGGRRAAHRPCVPDDWESYKIHYRYRDTFYHITIQCGGEKSDYVTRVTMDGAVVNGAGLIPLLDDRQEHHVEVMLG